MLEICEWFLAWKLVIKNFNYKLSFGFTFRLGISLIINQNYSQVAKNLIKAHKSKNNLGGHFNIPVLKLGIRFSSKNFKASHEKKFIWKNFFTNHFCLFVNIKVYL